MARRLRRVRDTETADKGNIVAAPVVGGRYKPLTPSEVDEVCLAAFDILARIGMADTPSWLSAKLISAGAKQRDDGRITFPRTMVEGAIARAAKTIAIPGFIEDCGIQVGGGRVHIGTGGAAVQVLDAQTSTYRNSTLADLYDLMRVLNQCPNIHYGVRPVVARDMPTQLDLDINTAFTCVKGTEKPIGVSFSEAGHVDPAIDLFDLALGHEDGFRSQPFCMAIIVHAVPPLRFAVEGVETMRTAIARGMPLQICSAGQAGATSPASLAGALAQGLAESLAGLMIVDVIRPGHPCIFAFMPFISDLRTGAMSGGGGESALANAAAAQLLLHLELPSTVSAGMTDSKLADAQAGYEKGYSVALAAQAGADMINLSVGMLGSIMVASPEAMVIDDEMCGAILRSVKGVDLASGMIDLDTMERVVTGEGHYLGEGQTLRLMKSEYTYPVLGDRQSVSDWREDGGLSIWDRAKGMVAERLLEEPGHLPKSAERAIRDRFPILLQEKGGQK